MGALDGELDGDNVVLPARYVGSTDGETVGAEDGVIEGNGVGFPAT